MLKKFFASGFAIMLILMCFSGLASAKTLASSEMVKTYQKQFSQGHYDYAKGSFKLSHAEDITLSKPISVKQGDSNVQVTHVIAAYATFKTVRDHIFYKDWKQTVFYAPDQQIALSIGQTNNVKELKKYDNQYPSGVSMELWSIGSLLLLLLLIPALFVFVWSKYQYSTLEFKIKNKLYHATTDQTYN